ncbi:MAG TPA: type II toxin-antitoxin system HicA family toxin [Polyangia bacterium]|jgi:predicted RNA binding protein YcfA (HicA-like mRNA interferase family)
MGQRRYPAMKAAQLLAALLRHGYEIAWQKGSHRKLTCPGRPTIRFCFHDSDEVGPPMVAAVCKKARLEPGDL